MRSFLRRLTPGYLTTLFTVCLIGCGAKAVPGNPSPGKKKPVFDTAPIQYDSSKYYIYLSFDDGPQHGTLTCLDLCRKAGVKASFFMVGMHAAQKSDGLKIVDSIRSGYPEFLLANHSYTHANNKYLLFYHHPYTAEQDFFEAQKFLEVPYKIGRFPGNSCWIRQGNLKASKLVRPLARLMDSAGYNIIGWDLEWHFNPHSVRPVQTPEQLAREVDSALLKSKTHTPRHLVLLSHDRMFQRPGDADSLARFIAILKRNPKYVFETVNHYPGLKKSL